MRHLHPVSKFRQQEPLLYTEVFPKWLLAFGVPVQNFVCFSCVACSTRPTLLVLLDLFTLITFREKHKLLGIEKETTVILSLVYSEKIFRLGRYFMIGYGLRNRLLGTEISGMRYAQ